MPTWDSAQLALIGLSQITLQLAVLLIMGLVARVEFLRLNGRLAPDTFTLLSHQGNGPRRGYYERVWWLHRLALTRLHRSFCDGPTSWLVIILRLVLLVSLPGFLLFAMGNFGGP
jgi:hypothetical protein